MLKVTETVDIAPALPERGKNEKPWHPETLEFWRLVWSSPMAAEYLPADVPGLVKLAKLEDEFNYGDHERIAEIRLQRQCFGLTPLDRRRLQWEIERGEAAEARQKERKKAQAASKKTRRSRDVLRAIK